VARQDTMRAVLAAVAGNRWALCQLDMETALLNGIVEEEVNVREPAGYERGRRGKVCRLLKALYGLKRASSAWYKKLTAVLRAAGMRATEADPCLLFGSFGGVLVFVLAYADVGPYGRKWHLCSTLNKSISTNGSNRPNSQTLHRLAVWTVGALVAGIFSKTKM